MAACPTVGTCAVTKALVDFYEALYRSGTPIGLEDRMLNLEDMFDFLDLPEIVIYPTANTYIIAKAVKEFFEALYRNGTSAGFDDRMIEFEEFNRLVGLAEIRQTEEKYYHQLAGSGIK